MKDAQDVPEERDDASALTTLWRERGVLESFAGDGSQSLAASDRALTSGLTFSSGELKLDDATRGSLALESLELGAELGRGGMGIVSSAVQKSLRREVAVKRLAGHADETGLASLLKEAWVGGLLAHPNVAPVHALVDLDGAPAVVMKRIAGTSWREVLRDPTRIPEAERGDALAFHLRVLVAVCNAVHHAHQRGVLHLDLKPENVMLGRFGETCVVDWGLAAGWGANAPEWMPRASEIRSVSGTPDYMAPEIASASGADISPRTDVYLLGATLHEAVMGRAPHRGGPVLDRMLRAYRSEPFAYPATVPEELARILHRAMHRDPSERYASAEAFRDAVESFVAHRRGEERIAEARDRVARLEQAVQAADTEIEIARAFGTARFALREAETARPGFADHDALRERLHVAMARSALDAGKLALAERYLSELASSKDDLKKRLDELRERDAARSRRVRTLEKIARDQDLDEGSQFRRQVLLGFSVVLMLGNFAYGWLDRAGMLTHDYGVMLLQGLGVWALIGGYVYWQRRSVFRNHANAVVFGVAILCFVVLEALWASLLVLEVPFERGVLLSGVVYLLASGAVTTLMSARFFPSVIFSSLGLLAAPFFPAHAWEIFGVASGASLATVGLAWPSTTRGPA